VLYVGISEWTAAQIQEAMRVADRLLLDRIVVNQPLYNMLDRKIEDEIIPVSRQVGIGQVVFSPLAQGMLTGKYKDLDHLPDGSRATNDKMNRFIQRYLNAETLDKVRRLGAVADGLGIPLAQMALAWILEEDNVASALIGASRPEQVDQNVKASGYVLPSDALEEIDRILG